jgi:hypothetical protein
LTFINKKGSIQKGWFLNNELKTDFYSFICLKDTTVYDVKDLKDSNQIIGVDILWVKKQDVKDYLFSLIDKKTLVDDIKRIRYMTNFDNQGKIRIKYNENVWLTYSSLLKEQPLNLVIHKKILKSFKNSRHFSVRKK